MALVSMGLYMAAFGRTKFTIEARERALAVPVPVALEEATAGAARALEPKEPLSVPVLSKQPTHEFAAYS